MERIIPKKKLFRTVSLFAGIGGFDLGFEYAGFDIIWANDFDKYACETYRANVGNQIVYGDIRTEKENIPEHDVLIGGFPCQPFSTLGKLEGFKDEERGTLFFEIKEILRKNKTKVVVLENVKNIKNHDKGRTFERILHELHSIGYDCYHDIMNSAEHGVPQRRNRLYVVGILREAFYKDDFKWPLVEELNVTTQDLLEKNVDEKYFLTEKLSKTILGYGTKGYIVKPTIDLPISKTLCATMHKMHRASQDNYVTDNESWENLKNTKKINIRKLTPDECRRLQGFPSDWRQVVSDCQAYKQFGNAVTVNVSYKVARELFQYMLKNLKRPEDN